MYSTLFAAFFQPSPPVPFPPLLRQTTVHQISSENAIPENILSSNILTNEILLVFVCENHFVDHPPSFCTRSSFFPFEAFTIHTPFVIRFSHQQHNPFFGLSFSVSKQISLPNNLCPTRNPHHSFAFVLAIHIHLFSRKIQKQRSEQPSLCLSHDGEHIDFCDIGLS
jgi:hypothetical protein